MSAPRGARVWYVAYGSNLCEDRFRCYLAGGTPSGSTAVPYPICAAGSEPHDSQPVMIPHQMYFARESKNWSSGGVAFLDPARAEPAPTFGRAWLLTTCQLRHLVAMENDRSATHKILIPWPLPRSGPIEIRESGWYRHLFRLDDIDGTPAVTLSGPSHVPRAPSAGYQATLRRGLLSTWPQLAVGGEVDSYLDSAQSYDPRLLRT